MIIKPFQDFDVYCLTLRDDRKNHVRSWLGDKVKFVDGVSTTISNVGRQETISYAWGKFLDHALRDRKTKWSPFVLIEDDCSTHDTLDRETCIPDDVDAFMLGSSSISVSHDFRGEKNKIVVENVDGHDDIYRVLNMLTIHGIMIFSPAYAASMRAAFVENSVMCQKGRTVMCDQVSTMLQRKYNVYAHDKPFVFQDKRLRGLYELTDITISKVSRSFDENEERLLDEHQPMTIKYVRSEYDRTTSH